MTKKVLGQGGMTMRTGLVGKEEDGRITDNSDSPASLGMKRVLD